MRHALARNELLSGGKGSAGLAGLVRLKTHYAGQTQITDRSLQMASRAESLERVILSACSALTNVGTTVEAPLRPISRL